MKQPTIEKTLNSKEAFIFIDAIRPYFNPNWHFHSEFQISYIIHGKGTRFIGDHVATFEEGDLIFTGPNVPHLWRSDAAYFEKNSLLETRGIALYFDHLLLSKTLLSKIEFHKINRLVSKSLKGISFYGNTRKTIEKLLLNIADEKGFKRIIRLLEILDIMADSNEYYLLASPAYKNMFKRDDTEKMQKVYNYVMTNFNSTISLDEVAAIVNMTTTSFCRYFKPRANKTFTKFVNEIRIGNAKKNALRRCINHSRNRL